MSEDSRSSDLLLGLLIGAAVGAGVALLLAPAPGGETRRRLGDAARLLGDKTESELGRIKETIKKSVA